MTGRRDDNGYYNGRWVTSKMARNSGNTYNDGFGNGGNGNRPKWNEGYQ
jgi:hypothetical protein